MVLWSAVWGFFFSFLHQKRIDYVKHFLWTAGYFLGVAIITCIIFQSYILKIVQGFTIIPFIPLAIVIAASFILYFFLPKYFNEPEKYFEKYPNREYLKIEWRRLISKSTDILAQQIFIVLLVTFLNNIGLSLPEIIIVFFILFGALHIPLISKEWGAWPSWLFGAAVVLFSIIFPILILTVHYGFVYAYLIHWLFYVVTAIVWTTCESIGASL
jgi:small-conductance mechanosensitive channel